MPYTIKPLSIAHLFRAVGSSCIVALLLCLLALLLPTAPQLSSAAPASAVSDQAAVDFSAHIIPAVSVAVESSVTLDVAPSSTGSFATAPTTVTVSTNSREGYSLFLEAAGETNALTPQLNQDNPATITSLESSVTEANFPTNSWGVSLTGTNVAVSDYQPIPVTATDALISSATANATDTYTLNFAVKVDDTLPVDTYSGSVLLSAVANPVAAHNLAELVYMQNMTHEICENTAGYVDVDHYVTKQLIDTRDGKSYWVAKLADGNCWMVQNLALDLDANVLLTPDQTDIATAWTPTTTLTSISNNTSATDVVSWNLGDYVQTNPNSTTDCNGYTSYSSCSAYFTNISGFEPTYVASATSAVDPGNRTYDAHYLTGNLYTWGAATAGAGINASERDVDSSICPKGWRLPAGVWSSGSYNYQTTDTYKLAASFGYDSGYQLTYSTTNYALSNFDYMAADIPLYLVRAGVIEAGALFHPNLTGRWWSGSATISKHSADFASGWSIGSEAFEGKPVNPDSFSVVALAMRRNGLSIRCLAR